MKLSVLTDVHLLAETQDKISALVGELVIFPTEKSSSITDLIERTGNAEAILISPGTKLDASYFNACPTVKYICLCGTSKDNIDLKEVEDRGIKLTNISDYGDEPTAEFIFMQLSSLLRGIGQYQWQAEPHELMGKRIGIIGLGALGQAVAHLALAYKMQVSYSSIHRKPKWEEKGVSYKVLDTVLSSSDIIVLTGPTNTQILGKSEFSVIPKGTILVQGSMGSVMNRTAFLDWVKQEGNFAIFDYAAGEENYQCYKNQDRIIFPKIIAGLSYETKQRLGKQVVINLEEYIINRKNAQDG